MVATIPKSLPTLPLLPSFPEASKSTNSLNSPPLLSSYTFLHFPSHIKPYCVLLKHCAAGIQVTASHNPKNDNGYKVYWSNGSQIVSPVDVGVSAAIDKNQEPWPIDYAQELQSSNLIDPTQDIIDHYFPTIAKEYSYHSDLNAKSDLKIVFTPMHGVGKEWVKRSFEVTYPCALLGINCTGI